jgi:hypothetical protein
MLECTPCLNTKQFYILNSFKGDFWSCVACFSILLDLDSFDDFFNFLSILCTHWKRLCSLYSSIWFPVCEQHLNEFEFGSIKPSRFNNDIVENLFCQQKGVYNGNNSNPNYINYCKSVNSVLLGQSLKSKW